MNVTAATPGDQDVPVCISWPVAGPRSLICFSASRIPTLLEKIQNPKICGNPRVETLVYHDFCRSWLRNPEQISMKLRI